MEIHKPKAAHSWREFLVEIGTIICGILIALGLEQLIETLHWRHEVAETRRGLSLELGTLLGWAEARTRRSACVETRLDELAAMVDEAARRGRLPPAGEPSWPGFYVWGAGVWQSAMSAQTAAHLSPRELKGYSNAYRIIDMMAEANREEGKVWVTLYGLAGPGRPFGEPEAATYRQAISEARYFDSFIGGMGVRARQALDVQNIRFDMPRYETIVANNTRPVSICEPISGPPPSHYGAAPARGFAAIARANPPLPEVELEQR